MHVKKGETVIVIAGNDKGKVGEVKAVVVDRESPERSRVVVAGVNMRWKHKRPTQQKPKGERVQEECSIHHSNVLHYDADKKRGVRAGRTTETKR
jgi:large subunit ribosomal protein L24